MTADGVDLIGEIAAPIGASAGAILCLHPLPTAGGMMDSHIYKKAANRLPAMTGITVFDLIHEAQLVKLEAAPAHLIMELLNTLMLKRCFLTALIL